MTTRAGRAIPARVLVAVLVLAGLVAGCTTISADDRDPVTRGATSGTLDWRDCGSIECAQLAVPLDSADPDGRSITLAISRRPASGDRIGALLINPGGPGAPGVDAPAFSGMLPSEVREHFDIVGWDPRGVGESTAVDCGGDYDAFWAVDRSPDDAREVAQNVAAAESLAQRCAADDPDLLDHVSTADTVADVDRIRRALGDEQISFLGWSYGTAIGLGYLERFPTRLRSLVLDGVVDPTRSPEQLTIEQAVGFERALDAFTEWCAAQDDCNFGGDDPATAYDRLAAMVDQESLPGEVAGEARELGPGEFDIGVAAALYGGESAYPQLADALSDAAGGDASLLLAQADGYTGREPGGIYPDTTGAFYAIGCTDPPPVGDLRSVRRLAQRAEAAAPRLGPATAWLSLPCAYWPSLPDRSRGPVELRIPPGGPDVVVLGATGDPATPFAWSTSVARQLGDQARLVARDGEGHVSFGQGSECVDEIVADYLVDLTLPPPASRC